MRVEPGETAWSANKTDTEKQVKGLYDGMEFTIDLDMNGILPSEEYVDRSNEWCFASLHIDRLFACSADIFYQADLKIMMNRVSKAWSRPLKGRPPAVEEFTL